MAWIWGSLAVIAAVVAICGGVFGVLSFNHFMDGIPEIPDKAALTVVNQRRRRTGDSTTTARSTCAGWRAPPG